MQNYIAFSTTAIKFENESHFITDTIFLYLHFVFYSQLLIWYDHRFSNSTLNMTLICNLSRDWRYFALN